MCGITGIYNFDKDDFVNSSVLEDLSRVIKHRGPDDRGIYCEKNIGLGIQRLSIIDLNTGNQPIHNEDKTVWMVFNGEIYNYRELRKDLKEKHHRFYTNSDSEVIVHLYEEYGEEFVHYLNGMFAIALWDGRKKKFLLFRDRLGIKPLHYCISDETLLFGSEIKSILKYPKFKKEINFEALSHYFSFGYIPSPHTIYKNVKKLLPGHYFKYEDNQCTIKKYWNIEIDSSNEKSEDYYCEKIIEVLRDSIRLRLVSDVPLGAFLSGGIDSSLVVALMSSLMNIPVKTFSIGFNEQTHNELGKAGIISKMFNTDHQELLVNPDSMENINLLIQHFDEPFADSSAIPTFLLSKMTKEHVTVSLSGDGGDELFGGYNRYLGLRKNVPSIIKYLSGMASNIMPNSFRGKNYLQGLSLDFDELYTVGISNSVKEKLFNKDYYSNLRSNNSYNFAKSIMYNGDTPTDYNRFLLYDANSYLPDDILTKVDRMSMATSLETRVPFLDHRLVELAFTIPYNLKVKEGTLKYLLKKAAGHFLPNEIIQAPKWGFTLPVDSWFKNEMKETLVNTFNSDKVKSQGIFNEGYINFIIKEHQSGYRNHKSLLWQLYVFQLWYDNNMAIT